MMKRKHQRNQHHIFAIIVRNVEKFVPDIKADAITLDSQLSDYGCNSIDRADIIWQTLEDLDLTIPMNDFLHVKDIRGLTELMSRYLDED